MEEGRAILLTEFGDDDGCFTFKNQVSENKEGSHTTG